MYWWLRRTGSPVFAPAYFLLVPYTSVRSGPYGCHCAVQEASSLPFHGVRKAQRCLDLRSLGFLQIPSCFAFRTEKKFFFLHLGAEQICYREVYIYGNSPNFSLAALNANSESAVLGQGPGNGEDEQAERVRTGAE